MESDEFNKIEKTNGTPEIGHFLPFHEVETSFLC